MKIRLSNDERELNNVSLAVICALPAETDALISHPGICSHRFKMKNRRLHMIETPHSSNGIILLTSGMGKVRAAAETQFTIDFFNPDYIINFGSAGGVNQERKVGDIVIGEKYVEYDFQGIGNKTPFYTPDSAMIKIAQTLPGTVMGTIATADQNGDSLRKKKVLWERYGAECCDWEGAAVVRVASLNRFRSLVFRCISDVGCGDAYSEYKKNYKEVLSKSAPVFWDFVVRLLNIK